MAKRKPLLIGQMQFKTQTEARKFIQEILNTVAWLEPLEGDTHDFVLSLLERHPRVADKVGAGASHFAVDSDNNGDRCFYVYHSDGTRDHFSYLKSLRGGDDIRSLVAGALRRAVDDQIWSFRDVELAKSQTCQYTGHTITKDSYHVDHHNPTFLALYTTWLAQTGLQLNDVRVSDGNDNELGRRMMDLAQKQSWQEFHRNHARLRLLSPLGNLSWAKIEANRRNLSKNAAATEYLPGEETNDE
jgi:Protein of unknown function (DUF3223)